MVARALQKRLRSLSLLEVSVTHHVLPLHDGVVAKTLRVIHLVRQDFA